MCNFDPRPIVEMESLVESFCDFAERILTLFLGEYEDGHEQEEEYG